MKILVSIAALACASLSEPTAAMAQDAATAVAARAGAATTAQFDKGVAVYIGDQAGLMAGMSIALSHVAYKNMGDVE